MNPTGVTSDSEGTEEQSLVRQHNYRLIFKFLEIRSRVWRATDLFYCSCNTTGRITTKNYVNYDSYCAISFILCPQAVYTLWSALFCNITHRKVAIPFRRLGTICRSHLRRVKKSEFKIPKQCLFELKNFQPNTNKQFTEHCWIQFDWSPLLVEYHVTWGFTHTVYETIVTILQPTIEFRFKIISITQKYIWSSCYEGSPTNSTHTITQTGRRHTL
jgi:hypothetical protein